MTACKNFAKGGKAGRVITAALVATLSVGAPVVALATTGAETGSVDLLASDKVNFEEGSVAYKSGKPGDSFVYDEKAHSIVPSTVTPFQGKAQKLAQSNNGNPTEAGYYYFYVQIGTSGSTYQLSTGKNVQYTKSNGKTADVQGTVVAEPKVVGTYAVVIAQKTDSETYYLKTADTFTITGNSLEGATIFEVNPDDKTDVSDTTFTYDGTVSSLTKADILDSSEGYKDCKIGVALNGVALDADDYTLDITNADATASDSGATLSVDTKYYVKVTGRGIYADQVEYIPFTIGQLDLSTATIDGATLIKNAADDNNCPVSNMTAVANLIAELNDVKGSSLQNGSSQAFEINATTGVTLELVSTPEGKVDVNHKRGEYVFKISASEDNDYVKGSATFSVLYADYEASIQYKNGNVVSAFDDIKVDLSAKDVKYFDADNIVVSYNDTELKYLDAEDYVVEYADEDGNKVDEAALKNPGTYKVTVTVNYVDDNDKVIAKTATATVSVFNGNLTQDANVFVSYDGVNVSDEKDDLVYSGDDLFENVSITVKNDSKTYVAGTDYEVTLTKVVDGEDVEVDEMVDVDTYTLKVKPITFTIAGTKDAVSFTFTVTALKLDNVKVVYPYEEISAYAFTGEAITPVFEFSYKNDENKDVKVDVPADAYELSYMLDNKSVDEMVEVGKYAVTISASDENKNFDFSSLTNPIQVEVSKEQVFKDVPNGAYYTEAIAFVKANHYMSGYGNTGFFGPEDTIVRHQVATILFNIAGGENLPDTDLGYSEIEGWNTGFNDVDGKMYYAQSVAWAHQTGLVSGYGDGNFGPEDNISREQFAQMLFNYAKKAGLDTSVDTNAVLAKCADGASVSDWAREAVAWCVDNGLMGQGSDLMPTTSITRAQAAIMVMRFDGVLNPEE